MDDKHAEAGSLVADLKAKLHEAEQHITGDRFHDVDWDAVLDKADKLISIVRAVRTVRAAGKPPQATASPVVNPKSK